MTTFEDVASTVDRDTENLRREVRSFLESAREEGRFVPTVDSWVTGWDEEFSKLLGSRGFIGMTVPVEYGGQGRTYLERFAVTEELLAAGAPIAAHWIADRQIAPALLAHGTEEQKRKYLPRIAAGECYFGLGMSEPESGSDLASVRTRAEKVENGWILNGSKVWTSGAHRSEALVVLTRTESVETAGRHGGLTQFVVETALPGVEVRPILSSSGEHHFNEVFFTDVFLRDEDVLGAVGNGWAQVTQELSYERSGPERFMSPYPLLAAVVEGLGETAVDHEAGRHISRLSALHQMSFRVSTLLQSGIPAGLAAAQVKLLGGLFEGDVVGWADSATLCDLDRPAPASVVDILDRSLVQRPGFTLRGGTTEILSDIIARGLDDAGIGLARSVEADPDLVEMISDVMAKSALELEKGADDPSVVESIWTNLDDLGLVRLTGDPAHGGSGAGWAEAVVLLEAAAAHDVRLPLAEHDLLAGWLVEHSDLEVRPGPTGFAFVGTDGHARIAAPTSILKQVVVAGRDAAGNARAGTVDVSVVEQGIVRSSLHRTVDVRLDTESIDWLPISEDLFTELHLRGALARSAQMVGAIGRVVESAVAHTNERKQFGKALAKFQAVRALLANSAAEAALASTAVAAAVQAVGSGDLRADSRAAWSVAVAKSSAGRASEVVIRQGHQAHGAIGTTLEHDLHRYTTALLGWRRDFGATRFWDEQLARRVEDRTRGSVWAHVTGVEDTI